MLKTIFITISALLWMVSCQGKNEESIKVQDSSTRTVSPDSPAEPQALPVPDPDENPTVPLPEEIAGLTGTSWELVALVDGNTGEITAPYCPQNAKWGEACYTFTFDKDGAGFFNIRWRRVYVDFSYRLPTLTNNRDDMLIAGPESNYLLFYNMSYYIKSCSYENGELKFHCGDLNKNKYFLFKPLEERAIPQVPVPDGILNLANTAFQLVGLVDAATDELKIPCPNEESSHYKFTFHEGGIGHFTLFCAYVRMDFSRNPAVEWKYEYHPCSGLSKRLLDMAYSTDSCRYYSDSRQLKLFCDSSKHYLLFKQIQP